jgi:hypothetical protein
MEEYEGILLEIIFKRDRKAFIAVSEINEKARERLPERYGETAHDAAAQLAVDLVGLRPYVTRTKHRGEDGFRHTCYRLNTDGRIALRLMEEVKV